MSGKRKLSAKEIASDVRIGLSNVQIATKYQLPEDQVSALLKKLVAMGALTETDLDKRLEEESEEPDVLNPGKESDSAERRTDDDRILATSGFAGLTTGLAYSLGIDSWFWFVVGFPVIAVGVSLGYYFFLRKFTSKQNYVKIAGIVFGVVAVILVFGQIGDWWSREGDKEASVSAGSTQKTSSGGLKGSKRACERTVEFLEFLEKSVTNPSRAGAGNAAAKAKAYRDEIEALSESSEDHAKLVAVYKLFGMFCLQCYGKGDQEACNEVRKTKQELRQQCSRLR